VHKPRNLPLSPIRDKRGALQVETINNFGAGIPVKGPLFDSSIGFYIRPEDMLKTPLARQVFKVQPVLERGKRKNNLELVNGGIRLTGAINITNNPERVPYEKFVLYHRGYVSYNNTQNTTNSFVSRRSTGINTKNFAVKKILYFADETYLRLMGQTATDSAARFGVTTKTLDGETFSQQVIKYKAQRIYDYKTDEETGAVPGVIDSGLFSILENRINTNPYFSSQNTYTLSANTADNSGSIVSRGKYNIRDPYNSILATVLDNAQVNQLQNNRILYDTITRVQKSKSDIIQFVFNSITNDEPIHFRALISTIKENTKSEYNETKYVGRTERFVTYAGAKRSVTLEFNIVAFSRLELDNMWTRINYLTGLAFPRKASTSGFMVPPLFRLTVGGIYDNQPCYVESLDFTLLDDSITFDIESEVSQRIAVSMTITLLEKRSAFYNSPFYEISKKIISQKLNGHKILQRGEAAAAAAAAAETRLRADIAATNAADLSEATTGAAARLGAIRIRNSLGTVKLSPPSVSQVQLSTPKISPLVSNKVIEEARKAILADEIAQEQLYQNLQDPSEFCQNYKDPEQFNQCITVFSQF
jgi:hypothetical protein